MLNFRARSGRKRVIAENTVQESCPETGIHTNRKTCTPSPKDWGRKVLSKVWGLQPSFQWIQDCLHQALFLQSVNHSSLSENHWDHSAVGISDTSNAKNTKSSKVNHVLSVLNLIAALLASTDKEQEQVLTPFRSVCLRVQDWAHCQKTRLLLHLSPTVNIWLLLLVWWTMAAYNYS